MKNFANCTPEEFMKQAVKFRAPFLKWIEDVGIHEINARRPDGYDDMKQEEKAQIAYKIIAENYGEILGVALEKNLEDTINIMCMATFTDREDFNSHTMTEYLEAIGEMLRSKEVKSFFTLYLAPKMRTSLMG